MKIRRAQIKDMERIDELLMQVAMVHHRGRPDLFKYGTRKYTDEQLKAIIGDDERPILAAVDEEDRLLGYAFCIKNSASAWSAEFFYVKLSARGVDDGAG